MLDNGFANGAKATPNEVGFGINGVHSCLIGDRRLDLHGPRNLVDGVVGNESFRGQDGAHQLRPVGQDALDIERADFTEEKRKYVP